MKTTPDDPAQLPGATEEIVFAEGVGLANLSYWANKGSPACGSPSSPSGQPPGTAAVCRRGPASNRGNEFIMLPSLHFHQAQISP